MNEIIDARYPTMEAWEFFLRNSDDIRNIVRKFCPRPEFEIPNTRISIQREDGKIIETNNRATQILAPAFSIDDFDKAIAEKDSAKLYQIMEDAWLRAPEDRRVYSIPGFAEMCNILDFTIEGFIEDGPFETNEWICDTGGKQ